MMVNGLVTVTQLGLLLLLGLLGLRMYTLARTEPLQRAVAVTADAAGFHNGPVRSGAGIKRKEPRQNAVASRIDRTELFTQLHILAGLQDRDCRVKGLVLAEAPEAVRTYAAAWLYGASCALSHKPVRHSEALAGMVAGIVSRKTGIRQPEALQAISTLTSSSVLLACYRAGLEGAEFWQVNHYVPASFSLYDAVTSNAFI